MKRTTLVVLYIYECSQCRQRNKYVLSLIYFEVPSPFISVHLYQTAILKMNSFGISLQIQQMAKRSHLQLR